MFICCTEEDKSGATEHVDGDKDEELADGTLLREYCEGEKKCEYQSVNSLTWPTHTARAEKGLDSRRLTADHILVLHQVGKTDLNARDPSYFRG